MSLRDSPYLNPESAFGCSYAFDPESSALRDALQRPSRFRTEPIRSADLADDLPFLRRLIENACTGYDQLLAHPEFEPDEFFSAWHGTLVSTGPHISALDGIVRPIQALRRMVPNGHLTIAGLDSLISADPGVSFAEYHAEHESHLPDELVTAMPGQVRVDTLRMVPRLTREGLVDHVVAISANGDRESFAADGVSFTRRPAPRRNAPDADLGAYSWQSHEDTGVITLRSFRTGDPRIRRQLDNFVDDYEMHRVHRRLMFDLRGNGGGDLEPIRAWLARACRTPWQSWSTVEIMGPIAVCKRWNWAVEWQIKNGTVDTEEAVAERRRLADSWELLAATPTTVNRSSARNGSGDSPLDATTYVIVDRNSGSSGELAAIELKNAIGARIVGERTAGACASGQAARFVLPKTGLLLQIPTRWAHFDAPVEGVGWPVDAYLEDINITPEVLESSLPLLDATFDQA